MAKGEMGVEQENSAQGGYPGAKRATWPLTRRQVQILNIIETAIAETGVSPSRSEIARTAGVRNPPAIEPVLLALARRGLIELPRRAQRSIHIVDRTAAPIIKCIGKVDPARALASDDRTVDRAPGTLARRLGGVVDYFLHMHDRSLERVGVAPGDLIAMRSAIAIGQGNIVAGRDERGTMRWYRTAIDAERGVNCRHLDSPGDDRSPNPTVLHTDGMVAGVIRMRTRRSNSATASPARTPTRKQGVVLDIMRHHVRVRGIPPSLGEIAAVLDDNTSSGSVRAHIKGLEKKGLVAATARKQRNWWPTGTGTVPIVDIEQWLQSADRGERPGTVMERAPDTLAEPFQPRPDVFLAPSQEITQRLGLSLTDLVAVTATTDADDGDVVIARVGAGGDVACGELHWRGDAIAEIRALTGNDRSPPIAVNTSSDRWAIAGIVTGTVTFSPGTPGE